MEAKFVGNSSMGFITGRRYNVYSEVQCIPNMDRPCICIYDYNSSAWCPYTSLESVFRNWKFAEGKNERKR